MRLDSTSGTLSPFEAARAMSIAEASPGEPGYWSGQMQAVARRRDQICFMRIYDHFAPRVRLYLRGLGVREAVAEELAQEALLRLWQRADSYDADRSTLSTWLFRIARNLHIDRLRRENQWIAVDLEPALEIETETDNPRSPPRRASSPMPTSTSASSACPRPKPA